MNPKDLLRDVIEEVKVLYLPLITLSIVIMIFLGGWSVASSLITSIPQEQMGLYLQRGSSTDLYIFLEKMDMYKQVSYLEPKEKYSLFMRLCSFVITEYYLSRENEYKVKISCNNITKPLEDIQETCEWLYKLPIGSKCIILA